LLSKAEAFAYTGKAFFEPDGLSHFRRNLMKTRIIVVMLLTVALVCSSAAFAEKDASQEKVATVNGAVITRQAFDREMNMIQQRQARSGHPLERSMLLKWQDKILEGLIERELLYQECQKEGVKASPELADNQLKELKKRFPDEKAFEKALSDSGLSEADLRSRIEKEQLIQEWIKKNFVDTSTVTEEEMKTYYDGHPDMFKQPESVRAEHILIKVSPKATDAEKAAARKKIEEIQKKLKAGGNFEALAKEYSDDPSKDRGGDLGYFTKGRMVKPFEEAAFSLKVGEVSPIVETLYGYHLIKVVDRKPEGKISYEDAKERIQQVLKNEKVRTQLRARIADLKAKADIQRFLEKN
jgi:peptidyl-prolyl cis-trans isomerase C